MGHDTRPEKAVIDARGNTLFFHRTGGMINPRAYELRPGKTLFRFASSGRPLKEAVTGAWWVEEREFGKLSSFAQGKSVSIALAARLLCCVPPEWSDMGLLMRARVREPLLAYRGLGANVRIDADDGLGAIKMRAHNELAARRLNQLFIPGLRELAAVPSSRVMPGALQVEASWAIDITAANRGWIYT